MGPKRILVAEQDAALGASLRELLEGAGYVVHVVKDGHGVLSMYRSVEPDVILLDVMVPQDNGCRVSRVIRSLAPELKRPAILLMTRRRPGANGADEMPLLEGSRADGVLFRPFSSRELLGRIEAVLAGAEVTAA